MYQIFVSSLNKNMDLATKISAHLNDMGKRSEIVSIVEYELPLYDSFKEENYGIPKEVEKIISKMENSDGYIFISPEYNYSIPPTLTNMIAWVSRVGDDFRNLFNEKTILLATHSGSGGTDILNAMRIQFGKLGAIVIPREILTTYEKKANDKSIKKILEQFVRLSKS